MKLWLTEIIAEDPHSGETKRWAGPAVQALTHSMAQKVCDKNFGYCRVIGELIAEIDAESGRKEDFELPSLN